MRPQSAFTAFRARLLSAKYSAEWSGREWPHSANSIECLVHFFKMWSAPYFHSCKQWAVTPNPRGSNSERSAPNWHCYLQRAGTPAWMGSTALWEHITAFFKGVKPSEYINSLLFMMDKKGLIDLHDALAYFFPLHILYSVLLHNREFCNGCITKQWSHKSANVSYIDHILQLLYDKSLSDKRFFLRRENLQVLNPFCDVAVAKPTVM